MNFSAKECQQALQAELAKEGSRLISGISNDSRTIQENELFVALRTETNDGSRFVRDALKKGASGILVHKDFPVDQSEILGREFSACSILKVEDARVAIRSLAAYAVEKLRRLNRCRVVAVTGSSGKTSTKQMIRFAISSDYHLTYTHGNFNNLIGVPIVACGAEDISNLLLFELGISLPGEMDELVQITRPDIAVLTMVGDAHIEFLKNRSGVLSEKIKIFSKLGSNGTAVFNGDDPMIVESMKAVRSGSKISFGFSADCQIRCNSYSVSAFGSRFEVQVRDRKIPFELAFFGRHMVRNALAAIAVGEALGIAVEDIAFRLSRAKPFHQRLERIDLPNGSVLFDDTYNANPQSMQEGLGLAHEIARMEKKRALAILGDMAELGSETEAAHRTIGRVLKDLGFDCVWLLGDSMRLAFEELEGNLLKVYHGDSTDASIRAMSESIVEYMGEHRSILIAKGSRRMKMERVVEHIMDRLREPNS